MALEGTALKRLLFEGIRRAGGRLPPSLLLALLWLPSLLRAAIDVWVRDRRAPMQLPPVAGATRGGRQALYDRLLYRLTPMVGFWADRSLEAGWAARYDVSALAELRALAAERPVIMVTFHYGALIMIPSLLNHHGVPTALAVDKEAWPLSRLRQWRLDLAKVGDIPTAVPADARQMLRFLRPGRCLMVAVDFQTPEQVEVEVEGAVMRLSTPPLRLARLARATVVPMLGVHDGLWRIRLHLGRPVPDELLRAGDYAAVAAHVARELLPVAARAPGQALPTLVEAFEAKAQAGGLASAAVPSTA